VKFNISKSSSRARHEEGVWVSLDDEKFGGTLVLSDPQDGPAMKVASAGSRLYKKAWDRVVKKHTDVIRSMNFMPLEIREAAENEGLCSAITDWRMRDDEGQMVPFSQERLRELIQENLMVRERVLSVAGDLSKYDQAEEVADKENLSPGSGTHLNGVATPESMEPRPVGMTPSP
jgi:hypothetical protein